MTDHTYHYAHTQFGIDEIYIHTGMDFNLLRKLQQRAEITLDSTDSVVTKYAVKDMVLIFHKKVTSQSYIYRFLKFLHQSPDREKYLEAHTLLNEDEFFEAIKSSSFALVTTQDISIE
ncbi:MAG TPA: hypothetical protein VGP47_06775 [Parachlamydiaceae bacterium]|nr:hypothetical protein [Parachlamydiaceae bacterium]